MIVAFRSVPEADVRFSTLFGSTVGYGRWAAAASDSWAR